MNTEQKAEGATLFASSHPDIVKRMSYKSALWALVCIGAGVALLFLASWMGREYDALRMATGFVGVLVALVGLYIGCFRSRHEVYRLTGSAIRRSVIFFDSKQEETLMSSIRSGEFPLDASIHSVQSGCLKLEVLYTSDERFAGVQLFEFKPYFYAAVTPIHYYTDAAAGSLSKFIKLVNTETA